MTRYSDMETNSVAHMPKVGRQGKLLYPSSWHALISAIHADDQSTPAARALAEMVVQTHGQRAVRDL